MGICWSAPPAVPVATAVPVMAPNSMKDPEKPIYHQYPQQPYPLQYPYPQQQQQYYVQNPYPYPQQQQQQQQQTSPVTAFVGGLLLGSIVEDMLDPFD